MKAGSVAGPGPDPGRAVCPHASAVDPRPLNWPALAMRKDLDNRG
ncbi:hypothetical protein GA0070624_1401 [Micromonospora rhizosphaerae]|uniref:Uncharacterized protein n=1 Tax=Micromonospora rhizosphaerae TaxID=568872 RepID=A0A1C6RL47_9ACTN|nr:hypothetical protein GA0070624_1401 [Micromonospora rhizosphaerae]